MKSMMKLRSADKKHSGSTGSILSLLRKNPIQQARSFEKLPDNNAAALARLRDEVAPILQTGLGLPNPSPASLRNVDLTESRPSFS